MKTKPNDSKTLLLRLTDAAYHPPRRQCGLPGVASGWLKLKHVASFSIRPATVMQAVWVSETKLNHDRGWGDNNSEELVIVQRKAIPALVAGWLDARCDCQRHIYYGVTAEGWRRLDSGSKPAAAAESIKRDTRFELAYFEQLGVERKRIFTRTPNDGGELGWLPLPVSHHDLPVIWSPK